ncbi:hypothetical protein ACFOSC_26635 [Streptantibioticus rubrisoli]|uniref:Uncharacterized protein n=1 Tax=Streptantibioticus rubrisoli TaxID=1387313 RepID=A0ABT1PH63_9ACTN|nr:hypothetical protein [Streptantibioticus rubrisoli]MCQ4043848.1 hypothetical protein [Streptantibioticus rubrisoli]
MTWQSTLVEPVSAERLHLVQVTCRWCKWRSVTVDASSELGQAQVRSLRLRHECALTDPEAAFDDIVAGYEQASPLYAAVLAMEQQHPGDLPVTIGLKAWSQLDEHQQRQCFNDLLQAYVELVRRERTEDEGAE